MLRYGKLKENELKSALESFSQDNINKEVIIGSRLGEDCALLDLNGKILITTDPITATCENIESFAIAINSNDIYASGGTPFACTLTVLAPTNEPVENVINLIKSTAQIAKEKNIDIIGGHTEFTDAVNRTIVSVTMLGKTNKILSNDRAKVGDKIIVSKYLGIEGGQILANDNRYRNYLSDDERVEIFSQDLSVEKESLILRDCNVGAMHDITEGGLYGAVCEIASASKVGAVIYEEKLPILRSVKKLTDIAKIDIGGLISSGSMLIVSSNGEEIVKLLKKAGINGTVVGEITDSRIILKKSDGSERNLEILHDEIFNAK